MSDFELKPVMNDNPGICILSFSLVNEVNPGLRNKLRRLIDRHDLFVVGTTLFEGVASLSSIRSLISQFLETVQADQSGASLTNFEVWFMGTQRFSYNLDERIAQLRA